MDRKFKKGDLVIVKDTGTICMKVIRLTDKNDEEGDAHAFRAVLKALDTANSLEGQTLDENFNEAEHLIYLVECEWHDNNNVRHTHVYMESELDFCEALPPRTEVEGFVRKHS